jgi:hypothetical protein
MHGTQGVLNPRADGCDQSVREPNLSARHSRACPGHLDQEGEALRSFRDRRDKPGDEDGEWIELVGITP